MVQEIHSWMSKDLIYRFVLMAAVALAVFALGRFTATPVPPVESELAARAYYKAMDMAERYVGSRLETVSNQSAIYLHGVPPAPPYFRHKLQLKRQPDEMCSVVYQERLGYLIEVRERYGFLDYTLIIQSREGVREEYSFDGGALASAENDWVPHILVPGMLLEMKVQACGSGGHLDILEVATLPRYH